MFRGDPSGFTERVDIIGNRKFLDFVDEFEKLEELKLDTFELGKDKLRIITILPLEDRKNSISGFRASLRSGAEKEFSG